MYSFRYSSFSPCEPQGKIILKENHRYRFGVHQDINGKKWHINGYVNGYALAVSLDECHPYYTSTATNCNYGLVSQKWKPYKIEIQDETPPKN